MPAPRSVQVAPILLLALLGVVPLARAASGGPDAHGPEWFDNRDGCEREHPPFGPGVLEVDTPTDVLGPFDLGFATTFQGPVVCRAWNSPHGCLAFAEPSADDATPRAKRRPRVHFYRVLAADDCEIEEPRA